MHARSQYIIYHGRDGEVSGVHFLCEPVHLAACVYEDDGLCDGQRLIEITQGVQFPLLCGTESRDKHTMRSE